MNKLLLINNIVTFGLLLYISLHYSIPLKAYNKFINPQNAPSPQLKCAYQLKYFEFHYKPEPQSPNIIMLGDSIIRSGKWSKLLNRKDVINRGIAGDTLPCICDRLKYLKDKKAKMWFIEGGINDITWRTTQSALEKYKEIIDFVKNEGAIPVINLVLYISLV